MSESIIWLRIVKAAGTILAGIVILVVILVVIVMCLMLIFTASSEYNLCTKHTPEGYSYVSGYWYDATLSCGYETLGTLEYKFCIKELYNTQNHGTQVTLDTCVPVYSAILDYNCTELK